MKVEWPKIVLILSLMMIVVANLNVFDGKLEKSVN